MAEPKTLINCLSDMYLRKESLTDEKSSLKSRSESHISRLNSIAVNEAGSTSTNQIAHIDLVENREIDQAEKVPEGQLLNIDDMISESTNNDPDPKIADLISNLNPNEISFTLNITDDEKSALSSTNNPSILNQSQNNGVVFDSILQNINSVEYNELNSLLALCFFTSLFNNSGLPSQFKEKSNTEVFK